MNEISTELGRQTDAFWGPMSIGLPLFGILIVAAAIGSGVGKGVGGDMAGPFIIGYAILVFYGSTILGFIAACIAAKRNEKRPAMALIGILINAPPMLIGAFLFLVKIALLRMPNQALEPTCTAVTPRAGARVAPAAHVAHL